MSGSESGAAEAFQLTGRSVGRVWAAVAGVSLLLGSMVGVGFAIDLSLRNGQELGRETLILASYLSGLYTVLNLAGLGAAALALIAVGRRPGARVFLALGVGFYVLLNGALRFSPTIQPLSVVPHLTLLGGVDQLGVVFAALAFSLAVLDRKLLRSALSFGVGVAVLGGLNVVNTLNETPLRRDLAELVPEAVADAGSLAVPAAVERFENTRMVVLGFDGLSWEVLLPMLRRGELPGFASLLRDASYGYLDTLSFTISPVVWETISTGQTPSRHGIGYHGHFDFPGLSWRVRRLPAFTLVNSPMALRRLLVGTSSRAPWTQVVAASSDAQAARFWEIVSRGGISLGVFNWLNTEPATPLIGFSRGYYRSLAPFDYPPDLEDDFELPRMQPSSRAPSDRSAALRRRERALYDHFVELALRVSPEVLLFYTHFGDAVNHLLWKEETYGDRFFLPGLAHPEVDPGAEISSAHQLLDEILSDVLSRVTPETMVVVISDHGFDFRGYEHDNAPAGVWIGRGPGVRPGVVDDISVFDVTPTLLHVLGLPVADDMPGRVMPIAASGGALDRSPKRTASHGAAALVRPGEVDEEGLKKQLEYLRSLGYVN